MERYASLMNLKTWYLKDMVLSNLPYRVMKFHSNSQLGNHKGKQVNTIEKNNKVICHIPADIRCRQPLIQTTCYWHQNRYTHLVGKEGQLRNRLTLMQHLVFTKVKCIRTGKDTLPMRDSESFNICTKKDRIWLLSYVLNIGHIQ